MKVSEPTCLTKCSNVTGYLLYFCPIITTSSRSLCPPLVGWFMSVMESTMAEIQFGWSYQRLIERRWLRRTDRAEGLKAGLHSVLCPGLCWSWAVTTWRCYNRFSRCRWCSYFTVCSPADSEPVAASGANVSRLASECQNVDVFVCRSLNQKFSRCSR